MTVKLFYAPGACSFVPHALLEIAGAVYEPKSVKLHKGEQASPEYLAMNPRGQVPVLVDGDQVITQIIAIINYIDDTLAAGRFLPKEPLQRARVMERLAWFNNTVHPTFTHIFMPQKFSADETHWPELRAFNTAKFRECQAEIDGFAAKASPWLGGNDIGPLDLYALILARWGGIVGVDPKGWAHLWPAHQ